MELFCSLENFLSDFDNDSDGILSKDCFTHNFKITYKSNPSIYNILYEKNNIIKKPNDIRHMFKDEIVDYFYELIVLNKKKYLSNFYNSYIKFKDPLLLKWEYINICDSIKNIELIEYINSAGFINIWCKYQKNTDDNKMMKNSFLKILDITISTISMQKNDMSKRLIRNIHLKDILHYTIITNTVKSKCSFMQTLYNAFNNMCLEDRLFAPSSIGLFLGKPNENINNTENNKPIDYCTFFYLIQQYQPKASILNPYTINWILSNIVKGENLFTPVLSWSSYLLAFMHSNWKNYLGVDVMPQVCQKTEMLFNYYLDDLGYKNKKEQKTCNIICKPSESLLYDIDFLNKYEKYNDCIIICPPYYNMEIYSSGDQSIDNYKNYETWLDEYWENTVSMCNIVLKTGGYFCLIINNYVSLDGTFYDLITDLNIILLKYFKLYNVFNLVNRTSPLRMNSKNRTEMLYVYIK